jgi:metallo-beta-lactamase family protein
MMIASTREGSKRINDEHGARIIISAAGMMTGGRVLHHAQRVLPDPNAALIFVGYQGEGTTGRLIRDGAKEVTIYKTPCQVRCHIESVDGLSSHADWHDTLQWLGRSAAAPKTTFVTHGEPDSAQALKLHIETVLDWRVETPELGASYELTERGAQECNQG